MIRVGEVSSVSWDLYIVTKGNAEEKHSEDGEWADYLGKYFYYQIWHNIFKKRFLTTCCILRNSPKPLTSTYWLLTFPSIPKLINFIFTPWLITASFVMLRFILLVLNLWFLASFFYCCANLSLLLLLADPFQLTGTYTLTLALQTSASVIIRI